MRVIIFICSLLFSIIHVNGQEKYYNSGIGFVLFGDGDYSGVNYYNNIQFPVLRSLDLKVGIQIANASETRKEYYYNRHNVFNFANNFNLSISPVVTNLLKVSMSAGGIWRYRSEIVFNNSRTAYTGSGSPLRMIENDYNKAFDMGYNIDLTALIKLNERIYTGVCGQFIGYNKGSGLYSINFCFNYRL